MAAHTTLWQAIERQRRRRAGMLVTLMALWVVGASVSILWMLAAVNWLTATAPVASTSARLMVVLGGLPHQAVIAALISASSGVIYVALTARLSVLPHLISIGARPVPLGEHRDTVSALRDVAIAAGVSPVPRLYVIPDRVALNAFVMGRTTDAPVIAMTEALVDRGDLRLKRAVFANLVARFRHDGVRWTTDLFKVMQPIRVLLACTSRLGNDVRNLLARQELLVAAVIWLFAVWTYGNVTGAFGVNHVASLGFVLLAATLSVTCMLATLYALDMSYRGAHRRLIYSSDADGVMLLKDPEQAAAALKTVTSETTWLREGWRYLYLTYVDADAPSLFGHPAKVDSSRISHLSALAFPAQADTIRLLPLRRASEPGASGYEA